MGRGIIVALGLSLAANVFMGGFIFGKIAGGPRHQGLPGGFDMRRGDPEDFADLPPAARAALLDAYAGRRGEAAAVHRDMRALRKEFIAVLRADAFDRATAEALAAKFEALEGTARGAAPKLIIEAAATLSAEDRRALADHLDRRFAKRRGARDLHRPRRDDRPRPEEPPPAP